MNKIQLHEKCFICDERNSHNLNYERHLYHFFDCLSRKEIEILLETLTFEELMSGGSEKVLEMC